jgi:hypothetical protein
MVRLTVEKSAVSLALQEGFLERPGEPRGIRGLTNKPPSGPEDAVDLGKNGRKIGDMLEDVVADHEIKRLVREFNVLKVDFPDGFLLGVQIAPYIESRARGVDHVAELSFRSDVKHLRVREHVPQSETIEIQA